VTAVKHPYHIRCAVDMFGLCNPIASWGIASYRRTQSDDFAHSSKDLPLNNASSITKPLFVIQGDNDPVVSRSESDQIVNAVR
jgi:dipeptidyl aminopeptidase/acylaminoacyl peptidase